MNFDLTTFERGLSRDYSRETVEAFRIAASGSSIASYSDAYRLLDKVMGRLPSSPKGVPVTTAPSQGVKLVGKGPRPQIAAWK